MYVYRNTGARSCNQCCSGKAKSVTYSEGMFVALVTQHAMRMRHIVFCGLYGCTVFFSTLSYKRRNFRKRILNEYGFVALIFSTDLSETLLILRRIQPDTHEHSPVYT
jgi:hypothetical protein